MGQLDNRSNNFDSGDAYEAEETLREFTQELRNLQHDVIIQLTQDIRRLQTEKARLCDDIEKLRIYHQQLQTQKFDAFSQRQIAQQQLWAKQLAQAVAAHLQEIVIQKLNQLAESYRPAVSSSQPTGTLPPSSATTNGYSENAYRLLASLDTTFSKTFKTLQQELNSYQSYLSDQINEMHTLEQQGTTILESLVNRLREQLQIETQRLQEEQARLEPLEPPQLEPLGSYSIPQAEYQPPATNGSPPPTETRPVTSQPSPPKTQITQPPQPATPPTTQTRQNNAQVQLGLWMVLLSTIALSIHNVVVRIIGNESKLLGVYPLGGFIQLGTGNSLMILWIRMLVVVPLMAGLAGVLYPPVWRDIKRFLTARDRQSMLNVIGSGGFLFLSQILIYIAIGDIGPGVAVTILFMYPIITVPLAWLLFGDRPTLLRFGVMIAVVIGVILTALPSIVSKTGGVSFLGVGAAAASGIAFAFYLIYMQLGFKKLHPVPVSLVQFVTIFILTSIMLTLPLPAQFSPVVLPENRGGLLLGGLVLGVLTLAGYLLNNFGVRFLGAGRASIIASSGPAVTALLAFLLIPGAKTQLATEQIVGILLVTAAVAMMSFERMRGQTKPPAPAPKPSR